MVAIWCNKCNIETSLTKVRWEGVEGMMDLKRWSTNPSTSSKHHTSSNSLSNSSLLGQPVAANTLLPPPHSHVTPNVFAAAAAIEDLALELGLGIGMSSGGTGLSSIPSVVASASLPTGATVAGAAPGSGPGGSGGMLPASGAAGTVITPAIATIAWLNEFIREMKVAAARRPDLLDKLSRKIKIYVRFGPLFHPSRFLSGFCV
jgi:hypothetical protein